MPWAWDDRICGVSPCNSHRPLPLLFRDYCALSGRGRFRLPNVEVGLLKRMAGVCRQSQFANDNHELDCALDANEPQCVGGSRSWPGNIQFECQNAKTLARRQDCFQNGCGLANRQFRSVTVQRNYVHWRDLEKPSFCFETRRPHFSKTLCSESPTKPRQTG